MCTAVIKKKCVQLLLDKSFVLILSENWFSVDAKEPIAFVILEVLEAADMKPSDLNGR